MSKVLSAPRQGTFQVNNTARRPKITVSADGQGILSQAGALLLAETLRVTGLGEGPPAGLARWRAPRAVHDPGKIVADLAAAVALGADCLADIAVLREQPELAGPVASDPVVSRLVAALAADLPQSLKAIRGARAAARERAWALAGDKAPGAGGALVTVDLDATIVIAHSDKEQAAPTCPIAKFHGIRDVETSTASVLNLVPAWRAICRGRNPKVADRDVQINKSLARWLLFRGKQYRPNVAAGRSIT